VSYQYDDLNQLIRENDNELKQTITYVYDASGNILEKKIYKFTEHESLINSIPENIVKYKYSDSNWKDKMTSYGGQKITYDEIGNPLKYRDNWNFEWTRGKKLSRSSKTGYDVHYQYNDAGIRTSKTVNGVKTDFITDGFRVLAQKTGNETIIWQIDGNSLNVGFSLNDEIYFYIRNAQCDIVGITDYDGRVIVNYTYDSLGKLFSIDDTSGKNIGEINPLRYRGYYYDVETGLYYLNSRYYDPITGRFINADNQHILLENCLDILDMNVFSYCKNNWVNSSDPSGYACIKWNLWGYEVLLSKTEAIKLLIGLGAAVSLAALTASISTVFPDVTISKGVAVALWMTRGVLALLIANVAWANTGNNGVKIKFLYPFGYVGTWRR